VDSNSTRRERCRVLPDLQMRCVAARAVLPAHWRFRDFRQEPLSLGLLPSAIHLIAAPPIPAYSCVKPNALPWQALSRKNATSGTTRSRADIQVFDVWYPAKAS